MEDGASSGIGTQPGLQQSTSEGVS